MSQTVKRSTDQRRAILEELGQTTTHPTADDLYATVRKRLPGISLGTVYRNLEALSAEGLVRKLSIAGTRRRFDGNLTEHYHIRCVSCGTIDDVFARAPPTIDATLRGKTNYQVLGHRLEFDGLCPKCKTTGHLQRTNKNATTT